LNLTLQGHLRRYQQQNFSRKPRLHLQLQITVGILLGAHLHQRILYLVERAGPGMTQGLERCPVAVQVEEALATILPNEGKQKMPKQENRTMNLPSRQIERSPSRRTRAGLHMMPWQRKKDGETYDA
jgi:hypothetical protein